MVGYHAAELLDIACEVSALQMAHWRQGSAASQPSRLTSLGRRSVTTGTGLVIGSEVALERVKRPLDTLVVSVGIGYVEAVAVDRLLPHVRRLARVSRRVASVCTGAGLLAAAGLLSGRRTAAHWDHAGLPARPLPRRRLRPRADLRHRRSRCTSAGVTASLGLTLAFVEADLGPEVARDVARQLVTYLQRPGNQAQMSMFTTVPAARNSVVRETVDYVAASVTTSPPPFAVVRQRARGHPGRHVRWVRTEAATHLLTGAAPARPG